MAEGMRGPNRYRYQDPTFSEVLSKFEKERKAAEREKRSMASFRVLATLRMFCRVAGYRILSDLIIQDKRTGYIYKSLNRAQRDRGPGK